MEKRVAVCRARNGEEHGVGFALKLVVTASPEHLLDRVSIPDSALDFAHDLDRVTAELSVGRFGLRRRGNFGQDGQGLGGSRAGKSGE